MKNPGLTANTEENFNLVSSLILNCKLKNKIKTKIIAIDGYGGSGKSTFAKRLSQELRSCPIVHTDDFATWNNPLNWYPRMIKQVFTPLSKNKAAKYQRFDWVKGCLTDWLSIDPQEFVIIEGVSSSRIEFREFLAFSIYIKTNRELCLQRGLERDGEDALSQWVEWMKEEENYHSENNPEAYADIIFSGQSE